MIQTKQRLAYLSLLFVLSVAPSAVAQTDVEKPGEKVADGDASKQPAGAPSSEVPAELRSPRALMATFLSAMDEAELGQIERYADALACLDLSALSDLDENAHASQARKLATLLNAFIGKHGIELELIPDNPAGEAYTYYPKDPQAAPNVQIGRDPDDAWRFTRESLAFVEALADAPAPEAAKTNGGEPAPDKPAQADPPKSAPSTDVPSEYRSARDTMRTFRAAMKEDRIEDAARCLDLSDYPLVIRSETGAELAAFLDATITYTNVASTGTVGVVLANLSEDPNAKPELFRSDGTIVIAREGERSERAGQWLFTKDTVAGIEALHGELEAAARKEAEAHPGQSASDLPTVEDRLPLKLRLRARIPASLKETGFLLQHWQWLGLAAILVLSWLAMWITNGILRMLAWVWLRKKDVAFDKVVHADSVRPVGILAASALAWWGLTWLGLEKNVLVVLLGAAKFVVCWATVWTVYRAVDLLCDYFASVAAKTETKMDDLLVPLARKVAKVVVTVLGAVFIIELFTEDRPFELLAGLGLGGLALALAAQDTLKNLFGSLTVIGDRPFRVGDSVAIGDVEGTVESVGFRSTRIRTFYNSQVVVPNATLMSATIDNFGARRYRRTRTMLSLTYDTPPEKIDAFCEGVRELIRMHPYTRKDYYHVYFNSFSASSLDILLYVFFDVPDWSTELREKHHLFCDILRLAKRLGVEFAFPTQTIWLERGGAGKGPTSATDGAQSPTDVGLAEAACVYNEAYGPPPTHRAPVVIDEVPLSDRCGSDDADGEDG